MPDFSPDDLVSGQGRNWIRLRTLTLLRWWAIAGQVAALVIADQGLSISIWRWGCAFW